MASAEFIRRLREKYGEIPGCGSASDGLTSWRPGRDCNAADLFERFLADASVPFAVFHSRRLGRGFVLARDAAALETLTEADRLLPVLTFEDCERLAGLDALDLEAVLDVKTALGPEVSIREVRPAGEPE